MHRSHRPLNGFTLVELSIVLAIIGLLIGGVLTGQSMIYNARVNKVLTDARAYTIAFDQFKDKYNAVPGDMIDAVKIWGRADGGTDLTQNCTLPYNMSSKSVGTPTCNGNGNGVIDGFNNSWASWYYETWRVWQQMAAAGLITGNFTGIGDNGSYAHKLGTNIPASSLDGSGFVFDRAWATASAGVVDYYGDMAVTNTDNVLFFGKISSIVTPNNYYPPTASLTPAQAYNVDAKIDDGIPGTGYIRSMAPSGILYPNCTVGVSNTPLSSTYKISYTSAACALVFLEGSANKAKRQ